MNSTHFADLEVKIQRWIEYWCESSDWPDIIIGEKTAAQMANAARAVFDACHESQTYARREGYLRELHPVAEKGRQP